MRRLDLLSIYNALSPVSHLKVGDHQLHAKCDLSPARISRDLLCECVMLPSRMSEPTVMLGVDAWGNKQEVD